MIPAPGQVVLPLGEAVDHLRRVVQITPDSADGHNDLGIALASRGDYEEAIGHFRQALQLDPDFAEAKVNLDLAVQLGRAPQ